MRRRLSHTPQPKADLTLKAIRCTKCRKCFPRWTCYTPPLDLRSLRPWNHSRSVNGTKSRSTRAALCFERHTKPKVHLIKCASANRVPAQNLNNARRQIPIRICSFSCFRNCSRIILISTCFLLHARSKIRPLCQRRISRTFSVKFRSLFAASRASKTVQGLSLYLRASCSARGSRYGGF